MAGNVLIKNANGKTVTLQNPDTNLADVVVDTSKIASKQYVDDADALKVALSSFTGTNQSLVGTGYQKLPGGLIIQWGSAISGAGGGVTITFPISFTATPNIMVSHDASGLQTRSLNITSPGAPSFSAYLSSGGVGVVGGTINWSAIGY